MKMESGWINFILLNFNALIFAILSIVSVMPVTLSKKYGEKAWRICYYLRVGMSIFIVCMIVNMILWIWFPIERIYWKIHEKHWVGAIIGIAILIPSSIFLYFALRDGGEEHMKPKKDRELFGGIYNSIRHPGVLGEMPIYIAIGFFVNSLFLVVWVILFVSIYTAIYIPVEEQDLVKRFGDKYIEYRKRTGALLPKFRKHQ
ncbi:MAG: methyltransferase family protein [Candidatus Thorarchaeota archaeon]